MIPINSKEIWDYLIKPNLLLIITERLKILSFYGNSDHLPDALGGEQAVWNKYIVINKLLQHFLFFVETYCCCKLYAKLFVG